MGIIILTRLVRRLSVKFAFIILHYCVMDDTVECVESIRNRIDISQYHIIIVDNYSPDGSGKVLAERYRHSKDITVIHNKENMGFSRGNNVGIRYARIHDYDFIVVLNNDTYLIQDDFAAVIQEEYKKSHFAVLGPKVYDPEGYNGTSPLVEAEYTGLEQRKVIYKMWKRKYWETLIGISYFREKFRSNIKSNDKRQNPLSEKYIENVPLHGCCLVFSPMFFKYFEGFEELTFMYGEETILKMNCDMYSLKMVYNPKLKIYHKEAVSTKAEKVNYSKIRLHNKRMMMAAKAIYLKAQDY